MADSRSDRLVVKGAWGTVEYAVRSDGNMPAKDWLTESSDEGASKFAHLFRKIAGSGKISNEQHFRKLRDDIWEFKRDSNRILCFQMGRRWLLTHHYLKQRDKCPPKEIDRAIRIKNEHIQAELKENKKKKNREKGNDRHAE